jgi:hypothetical protein
MGRHLAHPGTVDGGWAGPPGAAVGQVPRGPPGPKAPRRPRGWPGDCARTRTASGSAPKCAAPIGAKSTPRPLAWLWPPRPRRGRSAWARRLGDALPCRPAQAGDANRDLPDFHACEAGEPLTGDLARRVHGLCANFLGAEDKASFVYAKKREAAHVQPLGTRLRSAGPMSLSSGHPT